MIKVPVSVFLRSFSSIVNSHRELKVEGRSLGNLK